MLHERLVRQHFLGQIVIQSRVQGAGARPALVGVVNCPGVVFKVPNGRTPGQGFGDFGEVGLEAEHGKGSGVDLEGLIAGVEVGEGGDGGADIGDGEGFDVVDVGGVSDGGVGGVAVDKARGAVIVEDLKLVLVGWVEWNQSEAFKWRQRS